MFGGGGRVTKEEKTTNVSTLGGCDMWLILYLMHHDPGKEYGRHCLSFFGQDHRYFDL